MWKLFVKMHRCVILSLCFWTVFRVASCQTDLSDPDPTNGLENSPLTTVRALIGQSVVLPCDASTTQAADPPVLIMFYYEMKGTPIYTVDARGADMYSGEHWANRDQLGDRATMKVRPGNQGLSINRLVDADAGIYRCRVDFRKSPTKNMRIKLEIISPPRHLIITSSWEGGRVVSGVLGPYPEGADITLACQVTGGNPRPSLVWWQGSSLLDDFSEISTEQITRNSIRLPRLTRDDLMKKFTCISSNNNITAPLSSSITIDIATPPHSAHIFLESDLMKETLSLESDSVNDLDSDRTPFNGVITVSEAKESAFLCRSYGSRPEAAVIWSLDGRALEGELVASSGSSSQHALYDDMEDSIKYSKYDNLPSTSSLRIIPTIADHKAILSCTAYSPKLPDQKISEEITLNVLYRPRITISYSSPIPINSLEEGDGFTLSCTLHANPATGVVQWARNGVPLISSPADGIIIVNDRLDVQRSNRLMSGDYTCAAANTQGSNTSNAVHIRVKFTPICDVQQKAQYGAGWNEKLNITCSVISHPAPMTFKWAFNNSNEIVDFPASSFTNYGTLSTLEYTIKSEKDFGSLLCWGANDVGIMQEPCVIQIVPAAKPEAVRNCQTINNSSMARSMALISCVPGYDGGMNQSFSLEVREIKNVHSRPLASVQHSPTPLFNLKGLKHGEEYFFIITAVNRRGTSPPVTLTYTVPKLVPSSLASNSYDSSQSTLVSWSVFVAIIIGIMVVAVVIICAVFIIIKFKYGKKPKTTARIVYAGPIRQCEDGSSTCNSVSNAGICEKERCADINPNAIIHCVSSSKDDCLTLSTSRSDELSCETDKFRSSGSDVRISTPHAWNPDSASNCGDTYFCNAGPYHIDSLAPPPLPHYITPNHHNNPQFPLLVPPRCSQESLGRGSSCSDGSSSEPSSGSSSTVTTLLRHNNEEQFITSQTPLMQTTV